MTATPPRNNILSGEASPYLLQHAGNPVHWRPWSASVFAEARERDRPILLSVGYAACHWCHVMAHESFENDDIADLMNQNFVNVKVDREERPDIDQTYMNALHAMGEQGGWPLTMFLDPQGLPFWGGTYFPPEPRFGRPGFPQILQAIDKAWREDRDTILKNGAALRRYLSQMSAPPQIDGMPASKSFDEYASALLELRDFDHGGIRGAPKFPNAPMMEVWFRAALRAGTRADDFRNAFIHAVTAMSQGGIYDHVGGGMSRYSVDEIWLVPHFEKMLYDNAHLIRHLVWAIQLDPLELFCSRIEETIAWLVREMRTSDGAFASSLDADSQGVEGKYYVWTPAEIEEVLGKRAPAFSAAYDITDTGNFDGVNIPNRLKASEPESREEANLAKDRTLLLSARSMRIPPARDDKVLTDWNAYMIRALAQAGFTLARPKWIGLADKAFRFLACSVEKDGGLAHSWRNGVAVRPALATDIAAMINAAISLTEISLTDYLSHVERWLSILDADYGDNHGGYYLTSRHADPLPARPRCDSDEANPSGASQLIEAMVRAAAHLNEPKYLDRAFRLAANLHAASRDRRLGMAGLFNAVDCLYRHRHVKIFAADPVETEPFIAVLRKIADPNLTFSVEEFNKPANFLGTRITPPRGPSAVICARQSCSAPISDPDQFAVSLAEVATRREPAVS